MSTGWVDRDSRYLRTSVVAREQRHRRAVLLCLAVLIVLGTSPVVGHHLFPDSESLLAGRDHVADICLIALHMLLAPVHGVFHLLFGSGVLWASVSRFRAWQRLRRTLAALPVRTEIGTSSLAVAADQAGVDRGRIRIVDGLPTPALTVGWLRPMIYVAADLPASLTDAEVIAVLAHEGAHVTRRDPLRVSLLRFLADALFYLPALRRLADDMRDEAEISADDIAATRPGVGPAVVASAIVQLALHVSNSRELAGVGFVQYDILERRVRRLLGEETSVVTHVTRRSVVAALTVLFLAGASGAVMAHPISTPAAIAEESHCLHHHGFPGAHLFCLGIGHKAAPDRCPHMKMK